MAEEKKPEKKEKKSGGEEGSGGPNLFVDAIFWILFILVAFSVLKGGLTGLGFSFDSLPSPTALLATVFGPVQVFSIFLSLLFLIGIIYYNIKLGELHHDSHGHGHDHGDHGHDPHAHAAEAHEPSDHTAAHPEPAHTVAPAPRIAKAPNAATSHTSDRRWQNVQSRIASFSEGDWRLAILEADMILDDMLSRIGYKGEGVAEKLKQADKAAFHTIEEAWEAHKVRNRIAHDGPAYHLTHEEAERVIGLFKKVFDEFYFI